MYGKILIIPLILAFLAVGWFGRGIFSSITQRSVPLATVIPTNISTVAPTLIPIASPTIMRVVSTPSVPSGWQTYTNSQYGFTISFPANYKALTDKDNLYGWPNGVVLIYSGGQAYDIAIEVWYSENAYKQKYPTEMLTVYKVGDKFLTVADQTKSADNSAIIATFQLSK